MADEKVVAAGKSKEEVTFDLMLRLLNSGDGAGRDATRIQILEHYSAASRVVIDGAEPEHANKAFTS